MDREQKNFSSKNSANEQRQKRIEKFQLDIDENKLNYGSSDFEYKRHGVNNDNLYKQDNISADDFTDEINSYSNEDIREKIARKSAKELKEEKKLNKKIEREKGKKNRRTFRAVWLISVFIVGIFLAQIFLVGVRDMLAMNRKDESKITINIPENSTVKDISKILKDNGVISNTTYFELYAKATSSSNAFNQGKFEMRKNMDYEAIINYMQSSGNRTDSVSVTFSEGMSVLEIATKLKESGAISNTDEFLKLCKSNEFDEEYEFIKELSGNDRYYKLEGYLYPDTYEFYLNEEPDMAIKRFLSNYRKRVVYNKEKVDGFDKKVSVEQQIEKTKYSMDEIITLAAIIQAEALDTDDMYYISSVLHNRLEYGEKYAVKTLDCDATIFYPYKDKESVPNDIASTFKSPYNTYKVQGLPPGAICNPGMDAIDAAINPADTDYLFFCHSAPTEDKPSKAYYATNMADHEYNISIAGLK